MPPLRPAAAPSLFLALLLFAAAACAGERFDHGLLWRVDVPGAAPSYLFGTLHTDDDRVVKLSPPVRRAFQRARTVALAGVSAGKSFIAGGGVTESF